MKFKKNLTLVFLLFKVISTPYAVFGGAADSTGYRYRDLETGTFLTPDPLGFVDGPNRYTYVTQNPWTKFDPLGLKTIENHEDDITATREQLDTNLKDFDERVKGKSDPYGSIARARQTMIDVADGKVEQSQKSINSIHQTAADLSRYTGGVINASMLDDEDTDYRQFKVSSSLIDLVPGSSVTKALVLDNDPKQALINLGIESAFWYVGGSLAKGNLTATGGVDFVSSGSGRGSQFLGSSETGAIIRGSDGAVKKGLSRLSKKSGANQGDLSKRFHQIKKRGETSGATQRNQLDDISGDVFDGSGNYIGNVFDDF